MFAEKPIFRLVDSSGQEGGAALVGIHPIPQVFRMVLMKRDRL